MIIEHLFLWFYCLPIPNMLLLCAAAAAGVLAVHDRLRRKWWWTGLLAAALAVLAGGLLLQTVLGRTPGEIREPVRDFFQSYREVLRGGNRELLRSNLMNVMLFLPLGFVSALLLNVRRHPAGKFLLITAFWGALSFGIEFCQYRYGLGLAEADDLLHNTAGAALGVCAVLLWPRIRSGCIAFWNRIE